MPDSAVLANLEYDVAMDSSATSTAPPSRVSTGFSMFDRPEPTRRVSAGLLQGYRMPLHQDSGFSEPERRSFESEQIRHSLVGSIKDLTYSQEDKAPKIDERIWDKKESTIFGEGMRATEPETKSKPMPIFTLPSSPAEKKTAHTVPPLASVGPTNIQPISSIHDKPLEEKNSNTTIRPPTPDFSQTHQHQSSTKKEYDDFLSPAPDSDDEDTHHPATDDLTDYLSHSISFDHGRKRYTSSSSSSKRKI
jgi:hypothetical protein